MSLMVQCNLLLYLQISVSCRSFNPASLCCLSPFLLSFVTVSRLSLLSDFTLYLIGPQEKGSRKKKRFTALYKNSTTFLTLWFLNANWVKN